jgi:polysaccharide biosynthesis/export protein
MLVLVFLYTPITGNAQDRSASAVSDLYGLPKNSLQPPKTDAGLDGTRTGSQRPTSLYPNLRLNNVVPRSVIETTTSKTPVPAAIGDLSDFEIMVQQTLGTALPVYAKNLFQATSPSFSPADQINVPSDFILGPGDELVIRAWGSIELEYAVTVDRSGAIFVPKLGTLQLAGTSYKDAPQLIRNALLKIYKNFELSITMGALRSLRLYVTGYANAPGTYQINSLSTLISALFTTGGASPKGDLRRIELHRNHQLITQIDLYDFIANGKSDNDVRLQNEDVLYIPPLAGQVAIAGSIRQSAIYQYKAGMTLGQLIQLGGGTTATSDGLQVRLERISEDSTKVSPSQESRGIQTARRIVQELTLSEDHLQNPLQDGDLIMVLPISPQFQNAVTLRGQVALPLRYAWRQGIKISDIIPNSNALISPGYWIQKNSEGKVATFLTDPAKTQATPTFPEINWEYALVERILPQSLTASLIPFDLHKAVIEQHPEHNLELRPGDTITVFSRKDFRGPQEKQSRFIRIEGEVQRPGLYQVPSRATLPEMIEKAGGVTPLSYLYGTQLIRESTRQVQQKRLNETLQSLERDFSRYLVTRSQNVSNADESQGVPSEAASIRALLTALRESTPEGRLMLELTPRITDIHQLPPLRLEDNDSIYIPARPESVEVMGAVMAERSLLWKEGRNAEEYIEIVGGKTQNARRNAVVLMRPDGSIISANRSPAPVIMPGDTIYVEEETNKTNWTKALKDMGQIFYQFGLGAASIRILKGL